MARRWSPSSSVPEHRTRLLSGSARSCASPRILQRARPTWTSTFTSNAGPLLGSVHQPALVIHYRGDKVVPFAGGEHLARSLPDVRFLPLDGGYHLPDVADVDRLDRAVRGFLDGNAN